MEYHDALSGWFNDRDCRPAWSVAPALAVLSVDVLQTTAVVAAAVCVVMCVSLLLLLLLCWCCCRCCAICSCGLMMPGWTRSQADYGRGGQDCNQWALLLLLLLPFSLSVAAVD
jgi:hypothetical protein